MRSRILIPAALIGAAAAGAMIVPTAALAASTVVVTPTNQQGWVIGGPALGNPAVPTSYTGPADTGGGNGSFTFGPLGPTGADKIELQPPEVLFPTSDFGGLSYDFQVITPAAGNSADDFYTSIYVDSAHNGIGFFGPGLTSTGFYDCRYSFVPSTAGAGWNTFSIAPSDVPTDSLLRIGACGSTIDLNTAGSLIRFMRLNGGDTSTSDNGLVGAYDLVDVTVAGSTTTYDFEPFADGNDDGIPDTTPPTDKDQCKKGGFASFNNPSFKNQGQCVAYVNAHN